MLAHEVNVTASSSSSGGIVRCTQLTFQPVIDNRLQVSCRIHTLVQDADHSYAVGPLDVKNYMATYAIATVPLSDLIARASTLRISSNTLDGRSHFLDVDLSLGLIPVLLREVPDR